MKELDTNTKARLADYINGKPVSVSDGELQLMADSDELSAEIMDIAAISAEAEKSMHQGRGKTIRMIIYAAAACLVFGVGMGLIFQGEGKQPVAKGVPSQLLSSNNVDNGFRSLPKDIEQLVETASLNSANGIYDYPPQQPFDLKLSKSYDGDELVLCNVQGQELLRKEVNGDVVPIEGLSAGLYYYYLIYNPKEKGALAVGWNE